MCQLEDAIQNIADDRLQYYLDRGATLLDLSGWAQGFTMEVMAWLIGLPEEDIPVLRRYSDVTAQALGWLTGERDEIERTLLQFYDYCIEQVTLPQSEFCAHLFAELGDEMAAWQLLGTILASTDTTRFTIGMGLGTLLQDAYRDDWEYVVAQPKEAAPQAANEFIRYHPAVTTVPRIVLEDIEVGGIPFTPGAMLCINLIAASRDPSVTANPNTFNIRRQKTPLPGFGYGQHRCLGQHLAKMEIQAAIRAFARKCPNAKLDGELLHLTGGLRQIKQCTVKLQ